MTPLDAIQHHFMPFCPMVHYAMSPGAQKTISIQACGSTRRHNYEESDLTENCAETLKERDTQVESSHGRRPLEERFQ